MATSTTDTRFAPSAVERAVALAQSSYWQSRPPALAAARLLAAAGDRDDDPVLRGTALGVEASIALRQGDLGQAFEALEAAEREAARCDSPELQALLGAARCRLGFFSGAYHTALAFADEALALAGSLPLCPLQLDVRFARSLVLDNVMPGRPDGAVPELIGIAEQLGDAVALSAAHNDVACILLRSGDGEGAARHADLAVAAADSLGEEAPLVRSFAYSTRGEVKLGAGDAESALADLQVALANPGLDGEPYLSAMIAVVASQALAACDRGDEALATARAALDRLGERLPHAQALLLRQIGECLRGQGRHEEAYAALASASDLERRTALELSLRHHELQQAALEAYATRLHAEELASLNDDLQQLVAGLEAARAERERLLARTVEVAEDERIRVAIELHDGPIQGLTVVALGLDRLALRLASGRFDDFARGVAEIRDQLTGEMLSLRRLMTELRPPIIDERGLGAALSDCARQAVADSGTSLELRLPVAEVRFARELETAVYRVVREALLNAVRHSGAAHVQVVLETQGEDALRLLVADDGCGFDERDVRDRLEGHYGLAGMQERVESLAGEFRLVTAPGAGTRVEATLPLKRGA